MKQASSDLIAHLEAGPPFIMTDLFEFSLLSGVSLRYCSFDVDVVYDGYTYASTGPIVTRSQTRSVVGVEVDTLTLTVAPGPLDLIEGQPWIRAATSGALDGASLSLYRVFFQPDASVVGGVTLFSGQVAELKNSRNSVQITVNSTLQLLNLKMPRNLWQPGCLHTLYDTDCGATRSGAAATVASGSTAIVLNCGLSQAARWFDQGYIEFTSGALMGEKRTIKSYTPGTLQLLMPLPAIPVVGAGFTAYPGCDKTQATCQTKFGNLAHFRGFPYIPSADTVL